MLINTTLTFITGNQKKAEKLQEYLGLPIEHKKVDLEEIQSLDLKTVVEHKARRAYAILHSPVLVEDVALEFGALGRLPGTFIRFFLEELTFVQILDLIGTNKRNATARCGYGYYDGAGCEYFESHIRGSLPLHPSGTGGFGWDPIFIPYFSDQTAAELSEAEYERFYTEGKPIQKVREFLLNLP